MKDLLSELEDLRNELFQKETEISELDVLLQKISQDNSILREQIDELKHQLIRYTGSYEGDF